MEIKLGKLIDLSRWSKIAGCFCFEWLASVSDTSERRSPLLPRLDGSPLMPKPRGFTESIFPDQKRCGENAWPQWFQELVTFN